MGDRVTPLPVSKAATLAERLTVARQRSFVGREPEFSKFAAFAEGRGKHLLWFIVAPGGMGKTSLLQAFARHADACGQRCALLHARNIEPNPPAVRTAIEQALETPVDDTRPPRGDDPAVPLILVDTFEYWRALQPWLRDVFLPELPAELRIIFAGRVEPDYEWQSDPGWRELAVTSRLDPLPAPDTLTYLDGRGVGTDGREKLIGFAEGHPLALALGADTLLAGGNLEGIHSAGSPIIQALVDNFTREAGDPAQREALDACVVVRELNEDLLARILDVENCRTLYDWLRGLSFIEQGELGLEPQELVREALMAEMPQRFPGRYEAYAQAAGSWVVDRIIASGDMSWAAAADLAADMRYLLRGLPVVRQAFPAPQSRSLYLDQAQTDDWAAMLDMAQRHEGSESRHWCEHWLEQAPESARVIRDVSGGIRGFFIKLDMETLAPDARVADPLTRRLWQFLQTEMALRPGDHVPFIRFCVTDDRPETYSAARTEMLMAVQAYNLIAKNLRASALVLVDNPAWSTLAAALDILLLPGGETQIGAHCWQIYYQDWQRESPGRYYRRFIQRFFSFQETLQGARPGASADTGAAPLQSPPVQLTEPAFQQAVTQALKAFHDNRKLARNALLGSDLVLSQTERGAVELDRIQALRNEFHAALNSLASAGARGAHRAEVLQYAYLDPAQNQKAAAAALNMGYSTFRKHLSIARKTLAQTLWQREKSRR